MTVKTQQRLWDIAKAVLRGKFIEIQSYFRKEEQAQINNLNLIPKTTREGRRNKIQN